VTTETDQRRTRHVLLVCGSLRARSTNAAALRTVRADAPAHIVCSYYEGVSARGAQGALGELRTVLQYAHARIVEGAVADVPVTLDMVGSDGVLVDRATRDHLAVVLHNVVGEPVSGR